MDLRIGSLAALVVLAGCSAGDVRSTATGIQQWAANGVANREAERWGQGRSEVDDFRGAGGAPSKAAAAGEGKDQGGAGAGGSRADSASSSGATAAPAVPPPVIILR